MKHYVNNIARSCLMTTCQCKSCTFNGLKGMCMGCNECTEHKLLTPVIECSILKQGDWDGFNVTNLFGCYYMSIPTGICDIPEYYRISEEDYNTFEVWKNNDLRILKLQKDGINLQED